MDTPIRPPYGPAITLDEARALVAAAEVAARAIDVPMAIAIAEPTGDMVLVQKMDGTQYASFGVAMDKARSSARFRRPTKEFEDSVADKPFLLGLPGAVTIAGGIPIVRDGRLVGAIGVSGGASSDDHRVAEAALAGGT